jgi:predicted DNA-binding transcriptional regulator YafY
MENLNILLEAIDTGEILDIKYNGGSQPGALREIAPISVLNDKVSARCLTSSSTKTFYINKIEICKTFDGKDVVWKKDYVKILVFKYKNLDDFFNIEFNELLKLGWHIEYSKEKILSFHKIYKNGKIMKRKEVSLEYEKFAYDFFVNPETAEITCENERVRERPWIVRAVKHKTKTYGNFDKAVENFLNYAEKLATSK